MKKKVLFTASTFSHILNFHLPYLRRFQQLGWQVDVACGGELPEEIPGADSFFSLPLEKKMLAAGNFRAAGLLRQKMAAEQYALISTHTSLAAFFTRLALPPNSGGGGAFRPKVLNMVHGYLFDDQTPALKKTVLLTAEKLTAGCTDLLLTMNQWDLAAARRYKLGNQIAFIPGVGVDFSRFAQVKAADASAKRAELGLRPQDFVLIYAAEFSGRKNQAALLNVLAEMPEECLPAEGRLALLLPGSGALLADCQRMAAERQLMDGASDCRRPLVIFPGQQKNMPLWYSLANAAVSSSRSEGLPFNIMEAMFAGLPVVASDVKGHRDLLASEQAGLLYPYGDAAACAAQLKRLWQEPELAQKLAGQAKRSVEQYRLENVLPQVWEQYERLISQCNNP